MPKVGRNKSKVMGGGKSRKKFVPEKVKFVVFALAFAVVGVLLARYSSAARIQAWYSADGGEIKRTGYSVSASDPQVGYNDINKDEVIEGRVTPGLPLMNGPNVTVNNTNNGFKVCWTLMAANEYHPADRLAYNRFMYPPNTWLPNAIHSTARNSKVIYNVLSGGDVKAQGELTIYSGSYQDYCIDLGPYSETQLKNMSFPLYVTDGVVRFNKVSVQTQNDSGSAPSKPPRNVRKLTVTQAKQPRGISISQDGVSNRPCRMLSGTMKRCDVTAANPLRIKDNVHYLANRTGQYKVCVIGAGDGKPLHITIRSEGKADKTLRAEFGKADYAALLACTPTTGIAKLTEVLVRPTGGSVATIVVFTEKH